MTKPTVAERVTLWQKYFNVLQLNTFSDLFPLQLVLLGFPGSAWKFPVVVLQIQCYMLTEQTVRHKNRFLKDSKKCSNERAFPWCWEIRHRHFCFRRSSRVSTDRLSRPVSSATGNSHPVYWKPRSHTQLLVHSSFFENCLSWCRDRFLPVTRAQPSESPAPSTRPGCLLCRIELVIHQHKIKRGVKCNFPSGNS